ISRGQLVEIGGGFRIPDGLRQSGARLMEGGTTNRTYVGGYAGAITAHTAALLRVPSRNFRRIGLTHQAGHAEPARLAPERDVLLLDDLGSGCLLDTRPFGLAPEPTVQASVAAGVDLAMFSGDKLLGGPQAGVIVGRAELVDRAKRHPLARAVRLDKGSLAALTATLTHYARGEALAAVPVWRMIAAPVDELDRRARAWAEALGPTAATVAARPRVGGGSLPEEGLPPGALSVAVEQPTLAARDLRRSDPPIVARVEHDALLLDPRTVDPRDDAAVI